MAKYNSNDIELDVFKKSINNMIATSNNSYNGNVSFRKGIDFSSYTKQEIIDIINTGSSDELKDASLFYLYTSGYYRRFLIYYATLLKYIYLVIPHMNGNNKIEDEQNIKNYNQAVNFVSKLNLKILSKHIAIKVLAEGSYYGVLREFSDGEVAVQDLPSKYSRTRFKNQDDIDIVEFDVSYFDTIREKSVRDDILKSFPKEFRLGYNRYKNRAGDKWIIINPGTGVYFNLVDERPFFSSILPAIIDFNEYREIEKEKDKQKLKNLLVQKLPIEDGELVFDPEEAEEIHRGSVEMLRNNQYMDVLTTFADVKLEDLENSRSVITDNLEKISNSIYSEAGVSKELFAADGNTALASSIKNDMSLMMMLAEKIANWVQFLLKSKYNNSKMSFRVVALPISNYNEQEVRKDTLSLAQSGYSFLIPLMTLELEQNDLVDLKNLEINALQLNKIMIPLASSFTTSSGNPTEENPEDANKIPDDQKSDQTIKNINAES